MEENDFYIGWQDQAGKTSKRRLLDFFLVSILLALLFLLLFSWVEGPFQKSTFEYGKLTEFSGEVIDYPVFAIKTSHKGEDRTIPLVGFGKFSANPVLRKLKERTGGKLSGFEIRLRGTLIYAHGQVWMELTEGEESVIAVAPKSTVDTLVLETSGSTIKLTGEIVDPKCFFGVMNPAVKKVHKSCAIRCISGGIPPILAIRDRDGEFQDFYFIRNKAGQYINDKILQYVGIPVSLNGEVEQVDGLKVIKIDPPSNQMVYRPLLDQGIAKCGT